MDKKDLLSQRILEARRNIRGIENCTGLTFPIEIIQRMIEEEIGEKIWSK